MSNKTFTADGGGGRSANRELSSEVKQIALLFKTHLDLGFTDFASEIENKYLTSYIPAALRLSKEMRAAGNRRFVWTIGSYLISLYLERADAAGKKLMDEAIRSGDISWHALAFTTHTELMDESLLNFNISLSKELDRRYGIHTVAAKMTDVPGHTVAMLPVLARNGIQFLHIGVNPASAVPEVPDLFRWRDGGGNEIVVMYSKNDYGDMACADGCDTALCFAHTGDNRGPQSMDDILQIYHDLETEYPGVAVQSCGLNDFALKIIQIKDTLPVITGEIGDTWIHGAGTDPLKVAKYRALLRLRREWLASGRMDPQSVEYHSFSRSLLCIPEHTWGMARFILDDYENYSRQQLSQLRKTETCRRVEQSWQEQRDYLTAAVSNLTTPQLKAEAGDALKELEVRISDLAGYTRLKADEKIHAGNFIIGFDEKTGAVNYLKKDGRNGLLATPKHPIGEFMYEIFSNRDFSVFASHYLKNLSKTKEWCIPSFTRPGVPDSIRHSETVPEHAAVYCRKENGGTSFCAVLSMPEEPISRFGCPARVQTEYFIPDTSNRILIRLTWTGKEACRYTEALWLRINPAVAAPTRWMMDKMGQKISPRSVIRGGNRHLHALDSGMYYDDGKDSITVKTFDAPLVGLGAPAVVLYDKRFPNLEKGLYFNLYNNQWNTNFRYWYEEDAVFRFELNFD